MPTDIKEDSYTVNVIGINGTDQATGNEVLDMGIDRGLYPEARSYMIGASLTF